MYQLHLWWSWLCSWGRSSLHQLHSWHPCLYLSLSLSLTLCLVAEKWKEREGKSDFWTFFLFLFFEVDNFNLFSFFLWWSVWLLSKIEGIEGKEEMKGILWPLVCLRLCFVAKKKKKKSHCFSSLCGFVWLLRNEFYEGKMKGKNRKSDFWTFEFLFLKFLTSYLFIWVILG